jgi:serine/threonine protein kinase
LKLPVFGWGGLKVVFLEISGNFRKLENDSKLLSFLKRMQQQRQKTLHGAIRYYPEKSYVVKTSILDHQNDRKTTDNPWTEIRWLRKVPAHPHIISLLGYQYDEKYRQLHTFLPYAPYGDLKDWLMSLKKPLPFETAVSVLKQLLQALTHLAAHNIAHFDVSLENILLKTKKPAPSIWLCDFGCAVSSSELYEVSDMFHLPGKMQYRAPEFGISHKIDPQAADVFSFGVCMVEILTHHPPFRAAHFQDPHYRVLLEQGIRKLVPGLTPASYQVLEACLQINPKLRPTFAALAQFPLFSGATHKVPNLVSVPPISGPLSQPANVDP